MTRRICEELAVQNRRERAAHHSKNDAIPFTIRQIFRVYIAKAICNVVHVVKALKVD